MKRTLFVLSSNSRFIIKIVICLLLLNILVICLTQSLNMAESQQLSNERAAALSKSNLQFTFNLHKELSKDNSNVFFSPFSISTALAMTFLGAKEKTAEQMATVLGISDFKDDIHEAYERYLFLILDENENFTLHTANRLFPNHMSKVEADYISSCTKHYKTDVVPLDFSQSEAARKIINDWVSEKTKEKIQDLIAPGILSDNVFMVLVNAIYFKGNWASQFDEKFTRKGHFHINFSEDVEVDMMFQKKKFGFGYSPKHLCSVLELPYKGNSLSMVFILPDTVDGLPSIEDQMSGTMFNELSGTLRDDMTVEVHIPKFKLETKFELSSLLSKLGMSDAFNLELADFSKMDKMKSVFISKVIHKAFVEVNEEGTVAAAATGVVMMKRAAVRNLIFKADRPFLFFIKDKRTNVILFSGRYVRPEGNVISSTGREEL